MRKIAVIAISSAALVLVPASAAVAKPPTPAPMTVTCDKTTGLTEIQNLPSSQKSVKFYWVYPETGTTYAVPSDLLTSAPWSATAPQHTTVSFPIRDGSIYTYDVTIPGSGWVASWDRRTPVEGKSSLTITNFLCS